MKRHLLPALLVFPLAACNHPVATTRPAPEPAIHLAARLLTPNNVQLTWHEPDPHALGHIVEFATEPNGDFVTLDFLPPSQTSFKHPDLMPETNFFYRVRPLYGPASAPVEVSLAKDLTDEEYNKRFAGAEDYSWASPRSLPESSPVPKVSIRANPAAAAPADLTATRVPTTVSGFKLTWIDRANDEDGFLLEIKNDTDTDFHIVALAAPHTNSFGWGLEPPHRQATFRIRAFYYGQPSNTARETTGPSTPHPH